MKRIKTTYQIVTDESAKEGDYAEQGWEDEEGQVFEEDEEGTAAEHAIRWIRDQGGAFEPSCWPTWSPGVWYTSEAQQDMYTGEYRSESFHLEGFTEEEEKEIYKALTGRDPVTGRKDKA